MRVLIIVCLGLGLNLAFSSLSTAQEVSVENALTLCMEPAKANDRLACFEALARAAAPEQSTKIEQDRVKIAKTAQNTTATEPTIVAEQPNRNRFFSFGQLKKSSQKFLFVKPGDTPPAQRSFSHKPVERVVYSAKILSVWRSPVKYLYVVLDNGEVWKQSESGQPRMPKVNTVIQMKPGVAGAWFMSFPDRRPRVKMRLLKSTS
ncbi:MAG: hypothetical protein JKX99_04685 [Robiginitomaculum sp.]|nr:hypothetical protein [Robiginitomaculum sp.]